jgi:HD-like signal output (HDOD) protein
MSATEKNQTHLLSPDDLEHVFRTIEIPSCPALAVEAMAEAQKDEPSLKNLAKIIASDPAMTATTLKLANSPLFRTWGAAVTNVSRALEMLGVRNVVCVVVGVALRSCINGLPAAVIEQFWARATALASAAGMIARRQYGISPDAAYIYALFHNAAIPLMMRRFDNYQALLDECKANGRPLIEAEGALYPCTHPVVGSLLVKNWGLPPVVSQAIRFHHEADVYDLPDKTLPGMAVSLVAVTHVAEHLFCLKLNEPDLEVGDAMFARALAYLGMTEDDVAELAEILDAAVENL